MTEPIRRIPWPPPDAADPESLVDARVARDQRARRLRVGHRAGVITRRYHGLLIAALPAPLGRIVMLSHVAEQLRCADGRCVEIGGRERSGDAAGRARHRIPDGVPAGRRPAGVALRRRRARDREAAVPAAHAEHRAPHVRAAVGAPIASSWRCVHRSTSARRKRRSASRSAGRTSSARSASMSRLSRGSPLPPLRLTLCGGRRDVHAEEHAHRQRAVSGRGEPRLSGARRSVEPGLLHASRSRPDSRRRWSPRPNRSRR